MLTLAMEPCGDQPQGETPLVVAVHGPVVKPFDPGDPSCWLSLGRSVEHATALAEVWRRYPDLPASAPQADRMARGRERIAAMKPLNDAVTQQLDADRQAANFAFVERKATDGSIGDRELAILRGRDEHGFNWDCAVSYADGWYAAHAGWTYRGPASGTATPTPRGRSYAVGFAEGGGNTDDLFDAVRRGNLAALRADNQKPSAVQALPPRPTPSSWPKPTDHARPTRWQRRLLVISDALAGEVRPGSFLTTKLPTDTAERLASAEAEGLKIVTLGAAGFAPGYHPSLDGRTLSPAQADAIVADVRQGEVLSELLRGREVDDILLAAQGEYLRVLDAFTGAFPLCRTMERTRNSLRQQRAHLQCWLDRGHSGDRNFGAGHIRWGKAIKGLVGKLGEFTARHSGPGPGRGHLIRVEVAGGPLASGYVTATGEPLEPEIVVSNKAHLRREMTTALRAFGGATRLSAS